ncbi:NnrS family protein [Gemmobacter denitrificans]
MTAIERLYSEGFRVFFLSAGLYAVIAMGVWEAWLAVQAAGGSLNLPAAPAPHLWHAHEMIFGYSGAALAGFFLTAVPNWTGAKGAPRRYIAAVWSIWLAGRLAVWMSGHISPIAVAATDLAFAPFLGAQILGQLIRKPKPQQMIFLVLIAAFWIANLMVHLEWLGRTDTEWAGLRMGLVTLCCMIMVLGGRVTPGFTRNAMVQSGRETHLPVNSIALAAVSIAAAMALPMTYLVCLPDHIIGAVAVVAGVAGLIRVALWKGVWTLGKPILWTLHLSYTMNAIGLLLLGLANLGLGTEIAALHVLGIGAVGGMTLSVMSRASLGHTGRPLIASRRVALAYALVPLAALTRFLGTASPGLHDPAVLIAGVLWIAAFALYLVDLWHVWWGPRVPRAPVGSPP